MIAASFIRKPSDVQSIRDLLGAEATHIKIISKIENQEGLDNFDSVPRSPPLSPPRPRNQRDTYAARALRADPGGIRRHHGGTRRPRG